MNKKKILFLIPSLIGGGAERTLINLLQKIDYDRYQIDLVVVSKTGIYLNQVPEKVNLITLFNNDFFVRGLAFLQKKYNFSALFKFVVQRKIKGNYDAGICFLDSSFTDLLFFIKGLKRRITWVHSSYKSNINFAKYYKNESYKNKLKEFRYSKLDGINFVSHDCKKEFVDVFGVYPNMKVIYNLIDAKAIKAKSLEVIMPAPDKFTFVALGSLLPVKGFDRLIRAAKIVKGKGFSFVIQIIGNGPEEQRLRSLAEDYDLTKQVQFLGFKSNPYPYVKSCEVFIMSSVSEALPTVLCEAMILGKPVLVTDCSGCRELVDNEQFGLMASQNDKALAEKMIRYLSDNQLLAHYAAQSLERSRLFNDDTMLNEYYHVFDNL